MMMGYQVAVLRVTLLVSCLSHHAIMAFVPAAQLLSTRIQCEAAILLQPSAATNDGDSSDQQNRKGTPTTYPDGNSFVGPFSTHNSRRDWLLQTTRTFLGAAGAWIIGTTKFPQSAFADSSTAETDPTSSAPLPPPLQVEMKTFLDPMGLFVIQIPKRFFALRRSSQGDLPDAKGQGRRGSSIFTAGDLAKAEVIAVERFPIQGLLEENGIMVGEGAGDGLTTFGDIGKPSAVANLLNQHRERSRPGQSMAVLVPDSWTLSPNGKELEFMVKAEIDVQKPDLLLEQYGISRLFRVTVAKASLESNDGNVTAVFCSALEQDYQGPDGEALRAAAKSFRALDQSTVVAKT